MSTLKAANSRFEAVVRESFAKQGLMGAIGAWLVEVQPGNVSIELPFSARVAQQAGFFHGAVIGAIADSAGGYAALSLMPAGREVVTVEYKINFLKPGKGQMLRADGHVLQSGKTLSVVRVDVTAVDGRKNSACATLQATMMSVPSVGRG
ncbi:MAG: PaaI family thioesterase [Hyphomicrobiaceae bacterium]